MGCGEETFLAKQIQKTIIRWEKKIKNYLAMLHLACAWITLRVAEISDKLLT